MQKPYRNPQRDRSGPCLDLSDNGAMTSTSVATKEQGPVKRVGVGRFWLFAMLILIPGALLARPSEKKPASMRVILDTETFSPQALANLGPTAANVAALVDELIPGTPANYPLGGILCFEATPAWGGPWVSSSPPITLAGPKLPHEPIQSKGGAIRIAVFGVQPSDNWRFAFQLAHELGHVEMGATGDNYLDETFATALSFEVLRRLGYQGYLLRVEGDFVSQLPPKVQESLAFGRWEEIQRYWLTETKDQGMRMDDRPLQTLGALLLLRGSGPKWADLLNIAALNDCPSRTAAVSLQICPPDFARIKKKARRELKDLGAVAEDRHVTTR